MRKCHRTKKFLIQPDRNEDGSISPLLIGLAAISLAVLLTVTSALSLYVQQRRLTTQAESIALAEVNNSSSSLLTAAGTERKISVTDGETVEVRLCAAWQSPVPLGAWLNKAVRPTLVCGSAKARLAN